MTQPTAEQLIALALDHGAVKAAAIHHRDASVIITAAQLRSLLLAVADAAYERCAKETGWLHRSRIETFKGILPKIGELE